MKAWRLLESRLLVDRPWLRIHLERHQLPTGAVLEEFHLLESRPWAAVVALDTEGRLVLVDQYRRGFGGVSRELPAGVIDPGESPLQAARRELLEETGHQAPAWTALPSLSPEPSRNTCRAHLFFARGARLVAPQRLDPTEDVAVRLVPVAEALTAAVQGAMPHATHVAALLLAERLGLLSPREASAGSP